MGGYAGGANSSSTLVWTGSCCGSSYAGAQKCLYASTPPYRLERQVRSIGYFANIYGQDLPHRAKTVYMYLKDRCNKENQCYPAIGTIAKELNLSRRTVERAINDLIRAGLLKKEQRWRENGGKSSLLYTLIESS